ncbi:MAG: type II toxin-antitoxin system death-on-curing family toxin [Candidatus Methanoperedens sp.]|nr:type II toxin-antitoxin system death-on-curing family toxin [Candidatus Methanoperedens sp.]
MTIYDSRVFKQVRSKGNQMAELTVRKIIEIHDEIIQKYGGTSGVLSEATLEMLVYKVNREHNVLRQSSMVLHMITSQHPFFDGNKRTALVTAEKMLYDEGYYIHAEAEKKVDFMIKIAEYKCSVKTIEKWVKKSIRELHPG